jgi:demethylmenaquinone methyltransferase / 2-methoxy-6-polyprenyl-1,4-benzoquinol methylase
VQTATNSHARRLFDGIATAYDTPAEVFSFGQYGRWRRFAVRTLRLPPNARVLDVATGTGLVARDLRRLQTAAVFGLDQSPRMLGRARARGGFAVTGGRAEQLPFADTTFDGLTFTYLLRYVDDPPVVLAELARVLKPGAPAASVEFGVPDGRITGPLWHLYAARFFPAFARLISKGWHEVGGFLPNSIIEFNRRLPPTDVAALWEKAGFSDVRIKRMSFGAGVVTWGRRRG